MGTFTCHPEGRRRTFNDLFSARSVRTGLRPAAIGGRPMPPRACSRLMLHRDQRLRATKINSLECFDPKGLRSKSAYRCSTSNPARASRCSTSNLKKYRMPKAWISRSCRPSGYVDRRPPRIRRVRGHSSLAFQVAESATAPAGSARLKTLFYQACAESVASLRSEQLAECHAETVLRVHEAV